jgi:hypothetical protein
LILGLCFLCTPTLAEDADLPAGFLEFLGYMVEQDGELVDPLTFVVEAEMAVEVEVEVEKVLAERPSEHDRVKIESVGDSEVAESNE